METVLRLHWLGKGKIAAETNAAYFMTIWNLPQSRALENQTLNKLAQAPWRSFSNVSNPITSDSQQSITNSQNLLRPLLDDLVQQEFFLEARCASNKQAEAALAIRLDENRAGLWTTNLPLMLQSLGGLKAENTGGSKSISRWQLQFTNHNSATIVEAEIARSGEWTIVGAGRERCAIVTDLLNKIQKNGTPFVPSPTNSWVDAEFDPRQISSSLGWSIPEWLPKISLTINSEGNDLRTLGQFTFFKPLDLPLDPWNVPTNLIDAPLSHFTAIRGIAPLFSSIAADLQIGNPPNQLYFWAQGTAPMLTFAAAPVRDASNTVFALAERATNEGNLWMKTNGSLGRFFRPANTNALQWINTPFLEPHLEPVSTGGGDFLLVSFGPRALTNHTFPEPLLAQFVGTSNLVCYSWEMSHNELEPSLFISQFFRFALHKAQVPPESVGVKWLQILTGILGNCGTQITQTGADQLSFVRRSTIGFSSVELQLLVDWLESPTFPIGLTSRAGPPTAIITHEPKSKTNSPSVSQSPQGTNAPRQLRPER